VNLCGAPRTMHHAQVRDSYLSADGALTALRSFLPRAVHTARDSRYIAYGIKSPHPGPPDFEPATAFLQASRWRWKPIEED
jgi:hypothetical protein